MRVLPRLNEAVNEEWISDKARFACDGLIRQRLDRPYIRRDGKLKPATWHEAFAAIAERLNGLAGNKIAAIAGDLVRCRSHVRAEGADGCARLGQYRLPPGRRRDRSDACVPAISSTPPSPASSRPMPA